MKNYEKYIDIIKNFDTELVKNTKYKNCPRRYFAAYQDGVVYAWVDGKTSWSAVDDKEATAWSYVELAGSEEE